MVRASVARVALGSLLYYLGIAPAVASGEVATYLPRELGATTLDDGSPVTLDINAPVETELEAAAWSIIFTYPMIFNARIMKLLSSSTSVNEFYNVRDFPTVETNSVSAPNLDVLYSYGVLDLSESDVVLTVPEIEQERFWSFVVYDLYGNAIGEISNLLGHQAGKYRILRDYDNPVGLSNDNGSNYQGTIRVSTAYATIAARLGILEVTAEDLNTLRSYQDAMALVKVEMTASSAVPSLEKMEIPDSVSGVDEQFRLAARLFPFNPPQTISDRERVSGILSQAGLINGTYFPQTGIDLEEASTIANNSVTTASTNLANVVELGKNWTIPKPSFQGNFGTNYDSLVSKSVYYLQTQALAILPDGSLSGTVSFNTSMSVLITFLSKPSIIGSGFWNIGTYDDNLQLVPNELDRYAIGSNSPDIQYVNGGQVYGSNATLRDGAFQILLQVANLPPPGNWTGNWLPVAESGQVTFRVYGPAEAMKDGSYSYPTIEWIPAVKA
ncbi:hypothetical protein QIS74_04898 [Colletotrichum tabaci]|uniref:DUF1214 domain-containing protein n=1 Tax=Colletotrichum tabaci TaxID=1209068 RepID=A0AAV9TGX6_9PEZI